jgi:hypothetical protein
MKRLATVLGLMLALDGLGFFAPEPVCQVDQAYGLSCRQAVDFALRALPDGHAPISVVTLAGVPCFGYCPLLPGQPVDVTLADGTRHTIWLSDVGTGLTAKILPGG